MRECIVSGFLIKRKFLPVEYFSYERGGGQVIEIVLHHMLLTIQRHIRDDCFLIIGEYEQHAEDSDAGEADEVDSLYHCDVVPDDAISGYICYNMFIIYNQMRDYLHKV